MDNVRYKIGVYYIATGEYKKLFPEFIESLQNFYPSYEKVVKLISDGLEEYASYQNGKVRVELCPRISNYPWPIVTLYKMWHILENYDETFDFSCYFNGNSIVYENSYDVFNFKKITTSYHSFNSKSSSYDPWPHVSISKESCAYLENGTYEYIHGGFFFGPSNLIRQMCEDVVEMVKKDTAILIFAQWHDESYLNKWCVDHPDLVDKKHIMTVYKDDIDSTRFIYLRDKRDYSIQRYMNIK